MTIKEMMMAVRQIHAESVGATYITWWTPEYLHRTAGRRGLEGRMRRFNAGSIPTRDTTTDLQYTYPDLRIHASGREQRSPLTTAHCSQAAPSIMLSNL
jgi:hypothetical protein